MRAINIGCGPDLKEGWTNTDNYPWYGAQLWDITEPAPQDWNDSFDFALVNHTFCLLSYNDVDTALENIKQILKPGGVLEVIDMDVMKAIKSHRNFDFEGLFEGRADSPDERDERLCKHLVGYGRKSLYTAYSMANKLEKSGFKEVCMLEYSEHDLRPKESLIVQGTK